MTTGTHRCYCVSEDLLFHQSRSVNTQKGFTECIAFIISLFLWPTSYTTVTAGYTGVVHGHSHEQVIV
jgi:hypothetical protein